jgi:hypothetical protein
MFGINKLKKQILELTTKNSMLNDEILDYRTINQKLVREDEAYRISIAEKEVEIVEYKRVIEEQNKTIDSVNDRVVEFSATLTIYRNSEEVELLGLDRVQEQTVQELKENLLLALDEYIVVTTESLVDEDEKDYLLLTASINVLKNND